eukprot:365885-Chlamydomonas_euryale.AAC.1
MVPEAFHASMRTTACTRHAPCASLRTLMMHMRASSLLHAPASTHHVDALLQRCIRALLLCKSGTAW